MINKSLLRLLNRFEKHNRSLIQKEVKRSVLGRFCVDFVTFEGVCENMLLIFSKKDAIMWQREEKR